MLWMKKNDFAKTPSEPAKKNDNPARRLRRFGFFLIGLVVLCSAAFLAANGWYYRQTVPLRNTLNDIKSRLAQGVPDTALTEADKLAFYNDCATDAADLPARLAALNQQSWTAIAILKNDLRDQDLQDTQDQIAAGLQAVKSCHEILTRLNEKIVAYGQLAAQEPAGDQKSGLPARLEWYQTRLSAVGELRGLYANLQAVPDLALAGHLADEQDLGLDKIYQELKPYQEPVEKLLLIISASNDLESRLDAVYSQDPSIEGLADLETALNAWLNDQKQQISDAEGLLTGLPQPLQDSYQDYCAGLENRLSFGETWLQYHQSAVRVLRSLQAAAIDRETARRYTEDSLKEQDVQVAYIWTQTAEKYRQSMTDTLDFTNIYISETNKLALQAADLRQIYRLKLGLDGNMRSLTPYATVDAVAFWLSE